MSATRPVTAVVNDVHSRLNPTAVAEVVQPRSLEELQEVVLRSSQAHPVAFCGGRHGMGGQQFCSGGVLVDTRGLARVLSIDLDRGVVEVEAGLAAAALADVLGRQRSSTRQLRTGTGDTTAGGAVSTNAHEKGLAVAPFVADVEHLVLVDAGGQIRVCSRSTESELFGLACGGYGLFGAIYSVTLRLAPHVRLERIATRTEAEELDGSITECVAQGFVSAEFLVEVDPASSGFLRRGALVCERAVAADTPLRELQPGELSRRLPGGGVRSELSVEDLLATSGQVYDPNGRRGASPPVTPWPGSSVMRTELHVPRPAIDEVLADAAGVLRVRTADVVSGSVRLVERESETMLAWAREPWACVTLDLHVEHDAVSVGRVADAFRALIDVALGHGGSYHLAHHRWARRDQLEAAYPQIHAFIAAKQARDPRGVFQSDWYRHALGLLGHRDAA